MMEFEDPVHAAIWRQVEGLWRPNAAFGHGPDHASRVYRLGLSIAAEEGARAQVVGAACLLVDCGLDLKNGREDHVERSIAVARRVVRDIPKLKNKLPAILEAIRWHEAEEDVPSAAGLETLIVHDADTLDRLGFDGVRMTLKYGQWIGRRLCHRIDPLCKSREPELNSYTLDYLAYLKGLWRRVETPSGRQIASAKRRALLDFLSAVEQLTAVGTCTYEECFRLARRLEEASEVPV